MTDQDTSKTTPPVAPVTPPAPVPAQPVLQTGPKNIDWKMAYKFYCENKPDGKHRTYKDVAVKFDVSETSVEKTASKNSWVKGRDELGKKGIEEFKEQRINNIAKSEDNHLRIWRGLQQTALELLKDLRKDMADIKLGKKPAKLLLGNATQTTELRNLTGILETSISGERLVLGLPSTVSKADITSGGKPVNLTPSMVAEMDAMLKQDATPTDKPTN